MGAALISKIGELFVDVAGAGESGQSGRMPLSVVTGGVVARVDRHPKRWGGRGAGAPGGP
ncbi:hypothetical protein ACFYW1_08730 [Streptomyces sp. NPDC002669]|uniref:hypothetical protein n=1 Tax=unclassified Streptomyces TaxID=2593676 RepID=UPI00369A2AD1